MNSFFLFINACLSNAILRRISVPQYQGRHGGIKGFDLSGDDFEVYMESDHYMCGCLHVESTGWQAFIVGQDEKNRSTVRLCGVQNGRHFCVNDLLVQHNYAAVVGNAQRGMFCRFCHTTSVSSVDVFEL